MVDLLEEWLAKIIEINGDNELNAYVLIHLSQSLMTLITIFDDTTRLKKLVKAMVKVIEKFKEKVLSREQKVMHEPYKTCIKGINSQLGDYGYELRI